MLLNNFTLVKLCDNEECIIVGNKNPDTYYTRPYIQNNETKKVHICNILKETPKNNVEEIIAYLNELPEKPTYIRKEDYEHDNHIKDIDVDEDDIIEPKECNESHNQIFLDNIDEFLDIPEGINYVIMKNVL